MALDRVGFVGVGLMGHDMAKNIVEKGHPLTVVAHRNREPVEDLAGFQAHFANARLTVETGAFVERTVMKDETLGIRPPIVRVAAHDAVREGGCTRALSLWGREASRAE